MFYTCTGRACTCLSPLLLPWTLSRARGNARVDLMINVYWQCGGVRNWFSSFPGRLHTLVEDLQISFLPNTHTHAHCWRIHANWTHVPVSPCAGVEILYILEDRVCVCVPSAQQQRQISLRPLFLWQRSLVDCLLCTRKQGRSEGHTHAGSRLCTESLNLSGLALSRLPTGGLREWSTPGICGLNGRV